MTPIELYPFQARGLQAGREAFRAGARAVLFVGPTGMGKTTLASEAAKGVIARGGTVVAMAHRRELVRQMADRLELMGLEVGALGRRPSAPVQVVSVQSVLARRAMPQATFAIFDEAHHYVSNEWIIPARAYLEGGTKIMGLTATPERDDGRGLGGDDGIFDSLVVVAQVKELVALNAIEPDKGIVPIEVEEPETHVRRLAQAPFEAYLEKCPGRYAVVFSPNVMTAEKFLSDFERAGIPSAIVHGELPTIERDRNLARFANGDVRVLVNVNVLTEGWDAPICDVCMLARKIGSFSLLVQCIGRARRPFPGKRSALLIDLSGNLVMHGNYHPDDEIAYSLDGTGMCRWGSSAGQGPRICRSCRRVLDDDFARAAAAGVELTHCPECKKKISKLTIPTPEEVALVRVVRDAEKRRTPTDTRTKALISLYSKGLRNGWKKTSAEFSFRSMFKSYPTTEQRTVAWREAIAIVGVEKGDAWCPPEANA